MHSQHNISKLILDIYIHQGDNVIGLLAGYLKKLKSDLDETWHAVDLMPCKRWLTFEPDPDHGPDYHQISDFLQDISKSSEWISMVIHGLGRDLHSLRAF